MKLAQQSFIVLLFSICSTIVLKAQCEIENNNFKSGENLQYDLYVKLGFATKKGGYANLKTISTNYQGKSAYRMTLISHSQGLARKLFSLSDTLTSYMSTNMVPLAYLKDAHEGGTYTKERLQYTYANPPKVGIKTIRYKNDALKFDEKLTAPDCTYDLISILFYCRTLDYSKMTDGTNTIVNFISGKKRNSMRIVYNGKEAIKANDNNKYNCIKLTLYVANEAFDDGKEAMKVYISDDNNRIPIRLETKLKIGSTRVLLKKYSGNKYPLNAVKNKNE